MTDADIPSAYRRDKRTPPPSRDELRARIPGWGVDLDPADRPSFPKLQYPADAAGARWDFPERQPGGENRERSIEHAFVTPVFGTAQPLHGASGAVRRLAYARFSEGRLAHWLLLIVGDRLDVAGARLRSYASTRPDHLLSETGVLSEFRRHGLRSRAGRSDVRHQLLDPVVVAGPAVLRIAGAVALGRAVLRRLPARRRRG